MVSPAEKLVGSSLRTVLDERTSGPHLEGALPRQLLTALSWFVPELLGEIYEEWRGESLDGIYPVRSQKIGEFEIEIFGLCILLSDQTLVPIYLALQIDPATNEISWGLLQVGEKLTGAPGETGTRGMLRVPYDFLYSELKRIYRLNGNPDKIDWRYKVTFGERRP